MSNISNIEDVGNILLSVHKELEKLRLELDNVNKLDNNIIDNQLIYNNLKNIISNAEFEFRDKAEAVLKTVLDESSKEKDKSISPIKNNTESNHILRTYIPTAPESSDIDYITTFTSNLPSNNNTFSHSNKPRSRSIGVLKRSKLYDTKKLRSKIISLDDASKGLFHLQNTHIIPPNSDLSSVLGGIKAAPVKIHNFRAQFDKKPVAPFIFNANIDINEDRRSPIKNIINDTTPVVRRPLSQIPVTLSDLEINALTNNVITATKNNYVSETQPNVQIKSEISIQSNDLDDDELDDDEANRIRSFDELLDTYSLHLFVIRKGRALTSTPEFVSFRRKYAYMWGAVKKILEALLLKYNFSIAHVNGVAVAELAQDEFNQPTIEQLIGCLQNRQEFVNLLQKSGFNLSGFSMDKQRAATIIQAMWRMHICRKYFKIDLRRHRAAKKIQTNYRLYLLRQETKRKINTTWNSKLSVWRQLMADFKMRWSRIIRKRRVIVHIPSLSYTTNQRLSIHNFTLQENSQLARLCAVADPLVDVIYISPFPLTDELKQYYLKLFEVVGIKNAASRVKILYPENYNRFPDHFSLAQKLYYSPKTMKRIIQHIRNREAYIIPNHVGPEDLLLAIHLNLPLLAPEPEITAMFGTKSGGKKIFTTASVNVLPGEIEIFEESDLYLQLATLVVKHLDVKRWVIKLDDEFGGRGIAWFEPGDIKLYENILNERDLGRLESEKAVNSAVEKFKQALATNLGPKLKYAHPKLHSWKSFLDKIQSVGAIIEACPPSIIGSPTANVFIEPDGTCHIISTHDQIFSKPYVFVGALFPQQTLSHDVIVAASQSIGRACHQKGIIGYIEVDYVVCSNISAQPDNGEEDDQNIKLFAVDLNLRLTGTAAGFSFFDFLMQGKTRMDGSYMIDRKIESDDLTIAPETRSFVTNSRRFYCLINYIYSPPLSSIQFNSFFNLCRLKGVSFDLQQKDGTAVCMMDTLAGGALGLLSTGETQCKAAVNCMKALDFLQEQSGYSQNSHFYESESNLKEIHNAFRLNLKNQEAN